MEREPSMVPLQIKKKQTARTLDNNKPPVVSRNTNGKLNILTLIQRGRNKEIIVALSYSQKITADRRHSLV